jgi:hypothetical protein
MALVACPECGREVSDQALACPHCGYPIRGGYGYEYRSERQLFGLPLVHIVSGNRIDPATGKLRVAKGIIAIGPIAVGGLALGGSAFGVVSFGGAALGLIAVVGRPSERCWRWAAWRLAWWPSAAAPSGTMLSEVGPSGRTPSAATPKTPTQSNSPAAGSTSLAAAGDGPLRRRSSRRQEP